MDVIQSSSSQPFQSRIHNNGRGLSAQIKKNADPSINLSNNYFFTTFTSDTHAVRNLGVTFDPHMFSPTSSSTASCTSVTSAAFDPCLTLKLPPPSPPPSSILN